MSVWRSKRQPIYVGQGISSVIPEEPSLPSKRPRASSVASDTIDEPSFPPVPSTSRLDHPVPAKPKRQPKKTTTPKSFTPAVPWPEHFTKLHQVFKALNTVYTFCQTRRHLATTFDNLKGSVQGLLKRPLQVHDMAQIKSLLPALITFAWLDEEAMQVHLRGAEEEGRKGKAKEDTYAPKENQGKDQVLFFQFNDGELKSSNKGGKAVSKRRRQNKDGSFTPTQAKPTFSAASMTNMIDKRNELFTAAVNNLLAASQCQSHDPVALLLEAANENLPVEPNEADGLRSTTEHRADLEFFLKHPDNRPSIHQIMVDLKNEDYYDGQIVPGGHRTVEARESVFGDLDEPLSSNIMDALYATKKVTRLFTHQAEAINYLSKGQSVIVSTSTSSGKSLIYQLPALKAFGKVPGSTAMYIFPTKALAQDQKRSLVELLAACQGLEHIKSNVVLRIATFDGDTPKDDRAYIRDNASVIFTNPDMLHISILPREEEWRRFFQNLRIVVVDELHMYNGLFGCHVAYVMRRLRRICTAVGNQHIQFVSCSATVANPAEHMSAIFGIDQVQVVRNDGSPSGQKEYIVWNPPLIDKTDVTQGRVHSITEASRVFRFLMSRGIRAIVFCKIRKICELLMKQVRQDLLADGRTDMANRVMSYRSGYSAEDRRRIEQEMFSGHLLGIIATTALELGIDIGSLDAVITVGFPYTLSGLRQQAGRAGRRNKDSLSMLICDPWPLDQHYAKYPDELYTQPDAALSFDLDNEIVLEGHLQCAADELPISPKEDEAYFGPRLAEFCDAKLVKDEEGFYHCHARYKPFPSQHVSIRSTEDEHYTVVDITDHRYRVLEETELSRAIFEVYEGAIFMHQGCSFLVKEVSHDQKLAKVAAANVDWSTKQRDFTDVDAIEVFRMREIRNSPHFACYGSVRVTSVVFGYFKIDRRSNILDTVDIDTPPYVRSSHGVWLDVPQEALDILHLKNIHAAASIHAAEHALLSLTPMFVMSVSGDVRTECKAPEKEFGSKQSRRVRPARLTLYDAAGKSGGICVKAFDRINDLLNKALDTIINCSCTEGCPSCVSSTICSEGNIVLAKTGAMIVLSCLAGRTVDVDSIAAQPDLENIKKPPETIEAVPPVKVSNEAVFLDAEGHAVAREAMSPRMEQPGRFVVCPLDESGGFLHGV